MGISEALLDVVLLLGAGALLGGLLVRLRQSAIVGFLLAGVLLGPNALNVVQHEREVMSLSELGVALLLFVIGLEFSWSRLRAMGRSVLSGGAVQVVVTTLLAALVAWYAGLDVAASVCVGAAVALSSTASVLRVLTTRGEIESVHGERALGILLVQDIAVVPLVLLVTMATEGGTPMEVALGAGKTLAVAALLVAGLFVVFFLLVPRFLRAGSVHANREICLLVAVVSGLGAAIAAHAAGVSPALGAFLAGMLLAESPFAVQVRADVGGLKTLLMTLFFASIGMLADPAWIWQHASTVGATVGAVVVGKALIVLLVLRGFSTGWPGAIAAGLCLGQTGEFSFVLAQIGRGHVLDEDTFLLVVSTTVLTMMATPYLVSLGPWVSARAARLRGSAPAAQDRSRSRTDALVIGFGPAGRLVCDRLSEGRTVTVIDQNPQFAPVARALGYHAVTGDARNAEVLEHAGIEQAALIVVTVPTPDAVVDIVRLVRELSPPTRVLARGRFQRSTEAIRVAGAHVIADEEHEVGRWLAEAALEELEPPEEAADPPR